VVSVFLSGRPLWVNPEINASDAFVAAFLPGSEGGGVADLLFANADGSVRNDFHGRLSYSWPRRADQTPLNRGDAHYDPLFAYGFGLRYADNGNLGPLSEERPAEEGLPEGLYFAHGVLAAPLWSWSAFDVAQRRVDRRSQEDSYSLSWDSRHQGEVVIEAPQPINMSREATGELSLIVEYRVDAVPTAGVTLGMVCGAACGAEMPIGGILRTAPVGEWRTLAMPLRCYARAGVDMSKVTRPFVISSAGTLRLSISDVRIASAAVNQDQCGQP